MKNYILAILLAAVTGSGSGVVPGPLIIVNTSVKVSVASRSEIKDVFNGSVSELGDSHVTPVLLKTGAAHEEFLSLYSGKSDTAFRISWRSLVLSGQTVMPRSFDSDADVVAYVAHTPNAIGYIGRSSPHEGVKVVAVH